MTGYLQGMTRQLAALHMDRIERQLASKNTLRKRARKARADAKKAQRPVRPEDIARYNIKVAVGYEKGDEVFVTCRLSLNQLKEASRRFITGNGSYEESVKRVEQFKTGKLLS